MSAPGQDAGLGGATRGMVVVDTGQAMDAEAKQESMEHPQMPGYGE